MSAKITKLKFPVKETELETAVRKLIDYVGDDSERAGLQKTPARFITGLKSMLSGYEADPKSTLQSAFPNTDGYTSPLEIKGIEFTSFCEHHIMPFYGTVDITFQPKDLLVGFSSVIDLVQVCAKRLQTQERLTQMIAATLQELSPNMVEVIIKAKHFCIEAKGFKTQSEITTKVLLSAS